MIRVSYHCPVCHMDGVEIDVAVFGGKIAGATIVAQPSDLVCGHDDAIRALAECEEFVADLLADRARRALRVA